MNTLVNVARYHLVDRLTYVALPWGIMAFSFLVNLVIATVLPSPQGDYTGGLVTIYAFLLICGALSMTRSLPFGLMLGASRRTYYLGTALLITALGAVYGLGLTVLQAVERATGGWGTGLHFFRVPWIMDGPWYQTWLPRSCCWCCSSCTACGTAWCTGAGTWPGWSPSSPSRCWPRSSWWSQRRSATIGPPSGTSSSR